MKNKRFHVKKVKFLLHVHGPSRLISPRKRERNKKERKKLLHKKNTKKFKTLRDIFLGSDFDSFQTSSETRRATSTMSNVTPTMTNATPTMNSSYVIPNSDDEFADPLIWDDATWILSCSFIVFTMQTGLEQVFLHCQVGVSPSTSSKISGPERYLLDHL